jgi:peroxiredoxin
MLKQLLTLALLCVLLLPTFAGRAQDDDGVAHQTERARALARDGLLLKHYLTHALLPSAGLNGLAAGAALNSRSSDEVPDVAAEAKVGLNPGDIAPNFSLPGLDGESMALYNLRGRPVLVNFWATWCGPCRQEMPDFQMLWEERGPDGLLILAVNTTTTERSLSDVREFVAEMGLTFPILLDVANQANQAYRVTTQPTTVLVDAEGRVVGRFNGLVTLGQLLPLLEGLE